MNVTESRFKNRQLHIEDYAIDEKTCILDIRVLLNGIKQINLEMQMGSVEN